MNKRIYCILFLLVFVLHVDADTDLPLKIIDRESENDVIAEDKPIGICFFHFIRNETTKV